MNKKNSTSKGVSIIISCFNEENTIEECLQRLLATLPDAEIIVVHGDHRLPIERKAEA